LKSRDVLAVFNRGRISRLAMARTDVARVALSADIQTNWMPRTLGSMMVRPGFENIGTNTGDGANIPFIYSNTDTAILELSAGAMRVWANGDTLVSRAAVTATITNGLFNTDLSGWTDADEGTAASTWLTGGFMQLLGTGYSAARRRQAVSITETATAHALRIVVTRGPVLFRIGTTAGNDNIYRQAVLRTGTHSIAFVPGVATVHIEIASSVKWQTIVASCTMEAAGILSLPTKWGTAAKCKAVRWQQSADVVFCACAGQKQQRIERRPNNSWSVVDYNSDDGPFMTENVDNILLTPSALAGEITVSASRPVFKSGHVGALFRISSQGQRVISSLSADLTYTNYIRVIGVENERRFTVSRTGTWTGTLSLQRSLGEPGSWVTVATYTTSASVTYDDGLDNSIAYYRLGFESGGYGSGTVQALLEYSSGSITGTVRLIGVTSGTSATAIVLKDLGGTDGSEIWAEGAWSDEQDWPSAVGLQEGRLWWSGNGRNYASVPDAYTSFDPETIGDSQPINRQTGEGATNVSNWILGLQQLIVGTDGGEHSVRSTSFEEPVTPLNYNAKARTTKGSAPVPAASADGLGFFVGRDGAKLFELAYDAGTYGYQALEATMLCPEVSAAGIVRVAVQQSPDMRVHAVLADGTVALMVRDSAEDVKCWVNVETDGDVEDVVVLPGVTEDRVFYRVRRVIGGVTVRYHERWALESEARGGALNKMADSCKSGSGAITGLSHLNGKTVVIWGDGKDQGTAIVSGGTVPGSYANWCVGLPYTATYKSAKLAGQTSLGLSITQRSRINAIGLVLADTHAQGLQYGPSFDVLDDLPMMEDGALVDADLVWDAYDKDMVEFPGDWSTDNRICLVGAAPRPCTVLAAALSIDRQDKD